MSEDCKHFRLQKHKALADCASLGLLPTAAPSSLQAQPRCVFVAQEQTVRRLMADETPGVWML